MIRTKKLILLGLLFSCENNLSGADWFRNSIKPALKLGSGAVISGVGALVSGFSIPIATLSAFAGTWLTAEWQKNDHILKKINAAEQNIDGASFDLQQTVLHQNKITDLLAGVERSHQNLTSRLTETNQNLSAAHQGLECAEQSQRTYQRDFHSFIRQSQRRSAALSLGLLLQHRQIKHILNAQEELQKAMSEQNLKLQRMNALNQENIAKQDFFLRELDGLTKSANQNLAQQKALESDLVSLLDAGAGKPVLMPGLTAGKSATLQAILKRAARS